MTESCRRPAKPSITLAAANVPIIVAVNKIDKPGANPDKVMKGLSEIGIPL